MILALLLVAVIIIFTDICPVFKRGDIKMTISVCCLFFAAVCLVTLTLLGVKIPSPMMALSRLLISVGLAYK